MSLVTIAIVTYVMMLNIMIPWNEQRVEKNLQDAWDIGGWSK